MSNIQKWTEGAVKACARLFVEKVKAKPDLIIQDAFNLAQDDMIKLGILHKDHRVTIKALCHAPKPISKELYASYFNEMREYKTKYKTDVWKGRLGARASKVLKEHHQKTKTVKANATPSPAKTKAPKAVKEDAVAKNKPVWTIQLYHDLANRFVSHYVSSPKYENIERAFRTAQVQMVDKRLIQSKDIVTITCWNDMPAEVRSVLSQMNVALANHLQNALAPKIVVSTANKSADHVGRVMNIIAQETEARAAAVVRPPESTGFMDLWFMQAQQIEATKRLRTRMQTPHGMYAKQAENAKRQAAECSSQDLLTNFRQKKKLLDAILDHLQIDSDVTPSHVEAALRIITDAGKSLLKNLPMTGDKCSYLHQRSGVPVNVIIGETDLVSKATETVNPFLRAAPVRSVGESEMRLESLAANSVLRKQDREPTQTPDTRPLGLRPINQLNLPDGVTSHLVSRSFISIGSIIGLNETTFMIASGLSMEAADCVVRRIKNKGYTFKEDIRFITPFPIKPSLSKDVIPLSMPMVDIFDMPVQYAANFAQLDEIGVKTISDFSRITGGRLMECLKTDLLSCGLRAVFMFSLIKGVLNAVDYIPD